MADSTVACVRCGALTQLRSADVPYCVNCVEMAYRESARAGEEPPKPTKNVSVWGTQGDQARLVDQWAGVRLATWVSVRRFNPGSTSVK
jgi:hypothetical protein